MSNIRIPTLRQLESYGNDANTVLDMIEIDLDRALYSAIEDRHSRHNLLARLRRLYKRREEFSHSNGGEK